MSLSRRSFFKRTAGAVMVAPMVSMFGKVTADGGTLVFEVPAGYRQGDLFLLTIAGPNRKDLPIYLQPLILREKRFSPNPKGPGSVSFEFSPPEMETMIGKGEFNFTLDVQETFGVVMTRKPLAAGSFEVTETEFIGVGKGLPSSYTRG